MSNLIVLLFFILGIGVQMSYAQLSDSLAANDADTELSASFDLWQIPVRLNIPDDFEFINCDDTRKFLVNNGSSASSVEHVIGMIIPREGLANNDIDRARILSYYDFGHVNDEGADKMSYAWILQDLRDSHDGEYTNIKWAWAPEYNVAHHRLSLPLMYINGSDTTLNHRQFIFGNTDAIIIDPVVPQSDIQGIAHINELIANCVDFTPGNRYEDFNPDTQHVSYHSVSDFLKNTKEEANSSDSGSEKTAVTKQKARSLSYTVIIIIAESAIVLVAVMLLLMLGVAITNKRAESSKSIFRLGINVLLRILVFCMVYLLILTFAIFLIWAGVWLTIGILTHYISLMSLAIILVGWMFIGGFLWAIIRSLFVFKRNEHPGRLEISLADAPELHKLIMEISHASGEKMPKHTYLSPEVNACVFYNNAFLGIFSLGRKNLEIGLGLLFGLNKQELKAVIAHEYGHFGQKSMRIGQVVSVCYNIISNLVNAEGATIVRSILKKTFLYVQRGFMQLSRAMEYEADENSAAIAGTSAAVSALCKTEVMAGRLDAYNTFFNSIYESEKILPESYWSGYIQFLSLIDDFDGIVLDENTTATGPLVKTAASRVKLKDPWISHPLLEQRLNNIRKNNSRDVEYHPESVIDLVKPDIYRQSSDKLLQTSGYDGTISNDSDYKELLAKNLNEHSFPRKMKVFFNRNLFGFDPDTVEVNPELCVEDIFSQSNAFIMESFTQAVSDYQTMMRFKNKQISEKEIQYDGKVYNRKTVPVETQLEIIKRLEPRVASIDKSVFALAITATDKKELIMKAYDDIFYSQAVIAHITDNIIPSRDSVARQINRVGSDDEATFKWTQHILLNFKAGVGEMINSIQVERLNPILHVDMAEHIKRIEDDRLLGGQQIYGEEIQYLLSLPEIIISQFQSLAYYSKKIITDTIEGKEPLMFWNNSVASAEINNEDCLR